MGANCAIEMEQPVAAGERPFVSIIIPCRNERRFIRRCLDSLLANDYPQDKLEILILDALSADGTHEILREYRERYSFIQVIDNPRKLIPVAMNIGISRARGEVIMKADAHSGYPANYISSCVRNLGQYEAGNVGAAWRILPGGETAIASAIAVALAHPFGSGNALVKVGAKRPRWTDAVAFGCYRKTLLTELGGFNENLAGSSDMDLNVRIRQSGRGVLLIPETRIDYYADRTLAALWRHNFADGVWATYVLRFGSRAWSVRHWVPLALVFSLIACLTLAIADRAFWPFLVMSGLYAAAASVAAVGVAVRRRQPLLTPLVAAAFAVRHISHGLGALWGLILLCTPFYTWKGRRSRSDSDTRSGG
jgi:cellulose synthase/poly-beta-1,6-N-acetylglucosamine synthase-like glycosyltransferase